MNKIKDAIAYRLTKRSYKLDLEEIMHNTGEHKIMHNTEEYNMGEDYNINEIYDMIDKKVSATKENFSKYTLKHVQELLDDSIRTYLAPQEKIMTINTANGGVISLVIPSNPKANDVISLFISYIMNKIDDKEININTHNKKLDYLGYKLKNKTLIFNSKNYGDDIAKDAENCNIIFNKENLGSIIASDEKNCNIILKKNASENNFEDALAEPSKFKQRFSKIAANYFQRLKRDYFQVVTTMKAVDKFKQEKEAIEKILKMKFFNYPNYVNLHYDSPRERIYEEITNIIAQKTYAAKDAQEFLDCLLKSEDESGITSLVISYMINNTKEQEITIDTHDKELHYLGYKAKNKTLIFNSKIGSNVGASSENCNIISNNEYDDYPFHPDKLLENGMVIYKIGNNSVKVFKTKKCDEIKDLIPQIIKLNNQYFSVQKDKLTPVNELQAIKVLQSKDKLSELEEKLMEEIIGAKEKSCPECKKERPKISKKYVNICEKCGHEYGIKISQNKDINLLDEESRIMELAKYLLKSKKELREPEEKELYLNNNQIKANLAEKDKIAPIDELQTIETIKSNDNLSRLEEKLMEETIEIKENSCPECEEEKPKISKKCASLCEN